MELVRGRIRPIERLGPLLAVELVADVDAALERIDRLPYALTGGLFCRNPHTIERVVAQVPVGNLYINRHITGAMVGRQPFGGNRLSGAGAKAGGPGYLLEFVDRRGLERELQILRGRLRRHIVPGEHQYLDRLACELDAYFAGGPFLFTTPLQLAGTPFQRTVWEALLGIAPGTTRSYADIAATLGRPGAVRAVGRANGDNRLAIIVPCHRVIGSDGTLTGYGGGLWRKQWLLEHERAHALARAQPARPILKDSAATPA